MTVILIFIQALPLDDGEQTKRETLERLNERIDEGLCLIADAISLIKGYANENRTSRRLPDIIKDYLIVHSEGLFGVIVGTSEGQGQFQGLIRQFESLLNIINTMTIQDARQIGKDIVQGQEAERIKSWISPLDFAKYQEDVFARVEPGTGAWFLEEKKFKEWKDAEDGSILWCPGIRKPCLHIELGSRY